MAPPTAATPSLRKPTRSTQNVDALRRLRRHSTRSPHTADHSPQPCTDAPPPAPSFTRGAQRPLPPDEKNKGALRENKGAFAKKQGTFLKQTGTLHHYPRSCLISAPHKINKTASSYSNITVGVLIRGGYKKLVSFLFGQQGRDVYFCGVLQQYYTKTLHTMTI